MVEAILAHEVAVADRWVELRAETELRVNEMLDHMPESLQDAVIDAIESGTRVGNQLWDWLINPFVKNAPTITPDCRFPNSLVEFLLASPREIGKGHACQTCGLRVPINSTWTNDPDPPSNLSIFPMCPGYGGVTSYWVRLEKLNLGLWS